MTTKNRIRTILTLAAVAMAVFAGPALAIEGQYRLAFITSTDTGCQYTDIADYNTQMQALATAAGLPGTDWRVIGSTSLVDARDNTNTNTTLPDDELGNGTGVPIYLVDMVTKIADDNADLWDGDIDHIIDQDEYGVEKTHWPHTGTYLDGTVCDPDNPDYLSYGRGLDNPGLIGQGNSGDPAAWIWRISTQRPPEQKLPLYAMSELLTIGGGDPNAPDVDAGPDMITWSGEAVTLVPEVVVPPGSDWTNLTYLWSADPNDGVVFDPNEFVEAPTVTITKATDNPSIVTLTLAVNNAGNPPEEAVKDTMTIDVYDDSCLAAIDLGLVVFDSTDFNEDCITNFDDFAVMAITWLDDYTLTGPVAK